MFVSQFLISDVQCIVLFQCLHTSTFETLLSNSYRKCSNTCSLFIIHFLVYFYVSAYSHVLLVAPVQCVRAYVKMLMTELWLVL